MQAVAHLIFNPVSGQGDPDVDLAFLRSQLQDTYQLIVHETTPEEEARDLAQRAIDQGADIIIASGGDGTVSAVAAAVLQTGIPLGIIPRGTANAVAVALGISNNLHDSCQVIIDGHTRLIDAAVGNHHPMVLLAGIGLEANIVAKADRGIKDKLGVAGYLISAVQQLRDIEKFTATLETEERIIQVQASAITVANIAPATSVLAQGPPEVVPDDGLLDVTIFSPETAGEAIIASYQLFQSALENSPVPAESVGYFRCREVTISTDSQESVVIDGEVTGETPVHIRCLEKALKVFIPESVAEAPTEKLEGLPDLQITFKNQADPS